ncbi:MAG: N-acetylmuramoyl-L-alanine amidase family protein [Akkermansiaceae bacterium]
MTRYYQATKGLLVTFIIWFVVQGESAAFKWETVKHNGLDYVTLRSVRDFYFFDKIKHGAVISVENADYILEFRPGTQSCRMNSVLFILSHPFVSHNGRYLLSQTDLVYLLDPVLRPSYIYSARSFNTVVIDAGHGGRDSGSLGPYGNEKIYTLKVARMLREMLQKRGLKVIMTRDSDVYVSRENRVRIANKHPNAIFISIHFNHSDNSRASGIETFTISPVGVPHLGRDVQPRDFRKVPGNVMGSASIALATCVHVRSLLNLNDAPHQFNVADRGVKRARFDVLTGIEIPAVLFEGGFLSNRVEASKVNTLAYQQTLARAIDRAIYIYQNQAANR